MKKIEVENFMHSVDKNSRSKLSHWQVNQEGLKFDTRYKKI